MGENEHERISIHHYDQRVSRSLCIGRKRTSESEGRGGSAERESQIEIVNINFDGTREQRWFEGTACEWKITIRCLISVGAAVIK